MHPGANFCFSSPEFRLMVAARERQQRRGSSRDMCPVQCKHSRRRARLIVMLAAGYKALSCHL
jgi:hypothetical protein